MPQVIGVKRARTVGIRWAVRPLRIRAAIGLSLLAMVSARSEGAGRPYAFGTLAGSASIGSADGPSGAARFSGPASAAVDTAGNLYVADANNYTIRKITPSGVVTTLAGLAGHSGSADGAGGAARFAFPCSVAVDPAGNLYVADRDNTTIRMVTPTGTVSTLAGSVGLPRFGNPVDGTGSAARFAGPTGVAVDTAGNVYVADAYASTIRKIAPGGA